tara:strand:- start:2489 stop:3091 length:603 start_codon:yes stop_codon:yes gene_type:complete
VQNLFLLVSIVLFFFPPYAFSESNPSPKEPEQEQKLESLPPWLVSAELGVLSASDFFGGSLELSVGRKLGSTPLYLSIFYRYSSGFTADLGLLGGGAYIGEFYGAVFDGDLLSDIENDLRIGVKGGGYSATGVRSFLFVPYDTDKVNGWAIGPKLSFVNHLSETLGLGVRLDYIFYLLENSSESSNYKTIDIAFVVELRF